MSSHHPPHDHRLTFPDLGREIVARPDETVFQAARRVGLRIVGACGGRGTCGACTIRITEGAYRHGEGEDWIVHDLERAPHSRRKWVRACKVVPRGDCTIEVAPRSLAPIVRADIVHETAEPLPFAPALRRIRVSVAPPSLADTTADGERVARAVDEPIDGVDLAALVALPELLRRHDWSVDLRLRDRRIVSAAAPGGRLLGLAVDLGTTNVVGHLIDLETGVGLARLGIENPQVAWGADLVARLNHAIAGPAESIELQAAAVTAIGALAHDLTRAVGATPLDIVEVVACGNTAMQHLLLGLPVRQLGRSPFVAALREAIEVPASAFPLPFAPGAMVHVAANIGGFVGSDHVTALLATRALWEAEGTTIVMDIGTNTEISLIHGGAILSASCPSGPALEGGHIASGMRAAEGAIERVRLEDGRLVATTIGAKPAVGICGSGVIDTLAVLRCAAIVDARGRLHGGHPDTDTLDGRPVAVVAPGVVFTQADVRAVQLAKSAIMTGVELLMERAGIGLAAIDRFVVAGAFGTHVDVEAAIEIGLFPDIARDRILRVGNAAGHGVARMLASTDERALAADLARRCRYVELSSAPDFQKRFVHNIGFGKRSPRGES